MNLISLLRRHISNRLEKALNLRDFSRRSLGTDLDEIAGRARRLQTLREHDCLASEAFCA
jgi:hypothetical protein